MITEFCRNFTPEQMNFYRYASGLIAWNTITPLFYQGVLQGSEYLTYNAAKLYICLEWHSTDNGTATTENIIGIYNIANVLCQSMLNSRPYWDVTAAVVRFAEGDNFMKNFYFSRVTATRANTLIKFNGFRLTTI